VKLLDGDRAIRAEIKRHNGIIPEMRAVAAVHIIGPRITALKKHVQEKSPAGTSAVRIFGFAVQNKFLRERFAHGEFVRIARVSTKAGVPLLGNDGKSCFLRVKRRSILVDSCSKHRQQKKEEPAGSD